jgi:hypothetical protein
MRALSILALAVSALFTGCVLESDKPLSLPRDSDRDLRLEGLWRAKAENENGYTYIAYGPGVRGRMLWFGKDKNGASTGSADFFVTRTAKHSYLNVSEVSDNRSEATPRKTYMFWEYHFSWNGRMVIAAVGGDIFEKAVREGKLHGKTDQWMTTISHEPIGRLLAFIEAAKPKDVFIKESAMVKIGGP